MQIQRFEDFDAFAGSVRDLDCTMMLQNPARHSWTIHAAQITGVTAQMGRLGSGNIVEGQSWVGGSMIYLPLSGTCEYRANGAPIGKNSFMALDPGTEFVLSTRLQHNWCSISVPTEVLDREPDFDSPPKASQQTGCRVTRPDRRLADRFKTSVRDILAASAAHPEFESSLGATVASAELLELAAWILGRGKLRELHPSGRPKIPRGKIVRRSKQVLEERGDEHVSIADLVAATGVSERTLRTAFNETFGVGPLRYLQLRDLHLIRRTLRAAEPDETTVADVLVQHGEWQFGRCATRYQRLFGELPSETLRAKRH